MADFRIAPTTHAPVTTTRRRFGRARVAAVVVLVLLAGEAGARLLPDELVEEQAWPVTHAAVERQLRRAAQDGPVDVVVVGASHVVRAVDPVAVGDALGGVTVVNAGVLAAPPGETAAWTLDVVLPTVTPEVLVIGITPAELGTRLALRPEMLLDSPGYRRAAGTPNLLDRIETYSDLAQARTLLRTPWTAVQRVRLWDRLRDERAPLGSFAFLPDEPTGDDAWRDGYRALSAADDGAAAAVRAMVAGARAAGTDVVLLCPPVQAAALATVAPQGTPSMQQLQRRLEQLAAELDVPLLDLSEPPPTGLMIDPVHLTAQGRDWFTPRLAEAMLAGGLGT